MTKILRFPCDLARTMRNTLREFLIVIATVAKASCKHGLWLVVRVNKQLRSTRNTDCRSCLYLLSFLCRTAVIFIVRIDAAVSVSIIFRSDLLIPLNIYNKDRRTADIDRHRHCCAVDHGGTGYIRHIDRDLLVMAALLFNNIDRFINPRFFRHDHQGRIPFFQESAGRGKTGHAEFVFCE